MSAFSRAAASLVADRNLGVDAVYVPVSGGNVACRVILSRPLDVMGAHVAGKVMASLSAADVAAPARGASLVVAGMTYTVEVAEAEESRAMFDLTLSLA